MLLQLGFDACNLLLEDARFFFEQCIASPRREAAGRAFCLTVAFLLIALDYSTRTLAFDDADVRRAALIEGFRFGSGGKARTTETMELATRIAATYGSNPSRLRERLSRDLQSLPVEILAEHFGKVEAQRDLCDVARKFEARAYERAFAAISALEPPMQAVLGVLMDFLNVEREDVYSRM